MYLTAQLVITDPVNCMFPEVRESMQFILDGLGTMVHVPSDQISCIQGCSNSGMQIDSRRWAQQIIQIFEAASGEIITSSGKFAVLLRKEFPLLFADDPAWLERAKALADRTYEFCEYVVDYLGVYGVNATWPGTLNFHASCQLLDGLGITYQPRTLLSFVQGADVIEIPHADACCKYDDIMTTGNSELAIKLLTHKMDNIALAQSPTLVVNDTDCLMHLLDGSLHQDQHQHIVYIAEMLANLAQAD